MEHFSEVNWGDELGIDLGALIKESPLSGESIRAERKISKKAAEYWAHERFLAQIHADARDTIPDTQPEPMKIRKNRTKVSRYEFTEAQLQIAERSLDAQDSVRALRV
jgi:hypothetical protein